MTVALPVQGSVSLSILPQAVGRQHSTSCPSTSCYSGPLRHAPSAGGVRGRGGRKGRDHLGDNPSPLIPLPYYGPDCESETKQQQERLISCGFALCAYYVYWKDHYTGWTPCTRCSQPLTLQLVGRDLFLIFQTLHRLHKNESQLSQQERKYTLKQHDRTTFLIRSNLMCIDTGDSVK